MIPDIFHMFRGVSAQHPHRGSGGGWCILFKPRPRPGTQALWRKSIGKPQRDLLAWLLFSLAAAASSKRPRETERDRQQRQHADQHADELERPFGVRRRTTGPGQKKRLFGIAILALVGGAGKCRDGWKTAADLVDAPSAGGHPESSLIVHSPAREEYGSLLRSTR